MGEALKAGLVCLFFIPVFYILIFLPKQEKDRIHKIMDQYGPEEEVQHDNGDI